MSSNKEMGIDDEIVGEEGELELHNVSEDIDLTLSWYESVTLPQDVLNTVKEEIKNHCLRKQAEIEEKFRLEDLQFSFSTNDFTDITKAYLRRNRPQAAELFECQITCMYADYMSSKIFCLVDELPEVPKNNSFHKVFSFGTSPRPTDGADIDLILAGEKEKNSTGTTASMRSIGRTIPGPSASMDRAHGGAVTAGQAAQMAMQNLAERGERLNQVIDATENLKNSAMNIASCSSKLVEKYEEKK